MTHVEQEGSRFWVDAAAAKASTARCKACGAHLLWIVTANHRKLPLDVGAGEPADNGKLICVAHFATCPERQRFQKPPKEQRPCPVEGCHGRVRENELMCSACWATIPKRVQAGVREAWDAFSGGRNRDRHEAWKRQARAAVDLATGLRTAPRPRQLDAFGGSGENLTDPG